MINPAKYPPVYADGPLSYGMALFSTTLCSALALAMLLRFWFEARARSKAWKIAENPRPDTHPFATPLTVHRTILACFLVMVLLGVTPDAVKYLLWGEVEVQTMLHIQAVDQFLDGLVFIPFAIGAGLSAWGMQVVPQQLITETKVVMRRPTLETLLPHLKVVAAVLLLAAGITVTKAIQ